jgi:hypothetical protein
MNLLEIERLVRRITGVLRGTIDFSLAPKLAEDHVAACRAISIRLQQCEAMIKAGNFAQVIQLAETAPSVLDAITLLEFQEVDDWRGYCNTNRLANPEPFDPRSVQLLNDCYAKGITVDDPLYKRYRKAVLTRNATEALQVLKSIVKLNPDDTNANAELARLDRKLLGERLDGLRAALDASQTNQVLSLILEIESLAFQTSPVGAVWSQAQHVRAMEVLASAEAERTQSRWRNALLSLDFIKSLQYDFQFSLSPEAASRFAAIDTWAKTEEAKDKRDKSFNALLAELHYLAELSEQKDTAAKIVTLKELKGDFETLNKVWRTLGEFTRPIPDETEARFSKRSRLLKMEISRRMKRRLMMLTACTAVGLLVIGWATNYFLGSLRSREFAGQIHQAIASRQVITVEKLVQSVRAGQPHLLSRGSMSAAIASADEFIQNERNRLTAYQAAFSKLPHEFDAKATGEQLAEVPQEFAASTNLFAQLAGDLKAASEPELLAFQNKWEGFLADKTASVNLGFERTVQRAEQLVSRLDYSQPVDRVRGQLTELSTMEAQLTTFETGFKGIVKVREELLTRSGLLQARAATYRQELGKFDQGLKQLREARELEHFSAALKLLARSDFSSAPEVPAASLIEKLNISPEAVLVALLFPKHPALLPLLKEGVEFRFTPKAVMPAERELFLTLRNDPSVRSQHHRYRVILDAQHSIAQEWVTLEPLRRNNGWQAVSAYQTEVSPSQYTVQLTKYGFFDGKYRLTPTQHVEEIKELGPCEENIHFKQFEIEQILGPGMDNYQMPILETVERIKQSTNGSPLFRAYLTLRLLEFMKLQPEGWGIPFVPALAAYESALRQAGAGELTSGDWFAPDRVQEYDAGLELVFTSARKLSLWAQAKGLARLCQETTVRGLGYAGFVDLDGHPHLNSAASAGELVGYDTKAKAPSVLFKREQQQWNAIAAPLPLTPLFTLGSNCSGLMRRADIDPQLPEFSGWLPPMFADPEDKK